MPLHASALALLLLTARGGYAAPVLASLAHFVERAASPAAFSVESLLPELAPLLAEQPEWFAYCPGLETESITSSLVSPYAV